MTKSSSRRSGRLNSVAPLDVQEEVEPPKKLENTDKTQVSPESAPAPESVPAVASVSLITVSGTLSSDYKLQYFGEASCYNGTYTCNGTTKDVSFVPFEKVKGHKIYGAYEGKSICDGLIKPMFITYSKELSKSIICYDRFHCLLKDWLEEWHRSKCAKDSNGLPHPEIREKVRELVKSLRNIHKEGLLHLSLSDISNYVVIRGNWYIINFSGTLDKSNSEKRKLDLCGLRDMLKKYVLSDPSWQESKDFLDAFDMPNFLPARLVRILSDHVFFKCSHGRLQMFSVIYHRCMDRSPKGNMLSNAIRNKQFDCYLKKGGWDKFLSGVLLKIYGNRNNYDGKRILDLLRFLRNVYEHNHEYNGDVVHIEKEVRQIWPGLLEKLLLYY